MAQLIVENFETGISLTDLELYTEGMRKAKALLDNFKVLDTYEDGVKLGDVCNGWEITKVVMDFMDYADEFYLYADHEINKGHKGWEDCLSIEVVSKTVAEENEREYMDDNENFTDEEKANYELGKTVQWYQPLGKSEYWYILK